MSTGQRGDAPAMMAALQQGSDAIARDHDQTHDYDRGLVGLDQCTTPFECADARPTLIADSRREDRKGSCRERDTRNDSTARTGQVPAHEFIAASCPRMHIGHASIGSIGMGCRGMPSARRCTLQRPTRRHDDPCSAFGSFAWFRAHV